VILPLLVRRVCTDRWGTFIERSHPTASKAISTDHFCVLRRLYKPGCLNMCVYVNYVPEDDRIQVHPAEAYDLAQVFLWLSNFKN
jgi:hypothetical protein